MRPSETGEGRLGYFRSRYPRSGAGGGGGGGGGGTGHVAVARITDPSGHVCVAGAAGGGGGGAGGGGGGGGGADDPPKVPLKMKENRRSFMK